MIPKGLDARERKAVAELENTVLIEDASNWDLLLGEQRGLIAMLRDKHKDLIAAREDLRNLLWSVRLQGMSGEGFGRSGLEPELNQAEKELGPEVDASRSSYKPVFRKTEEAPTDTSDTSLGASNNQLDELLGDINE